MKNITIIVLALAFSAALFAGDPVVVDQTGTDFQYYWYVGTIGQQICVDDQGTVHLAYCKTWATDADTGFQVTYTNATTGTSIPIPTQEPTKPLKPAVVWIDGGHNSTPVYMYYGVGSRVYSYANQMHLQAMAQLSADGTAIEPLGVQEDKNYYADAYYANPFELEVNNTTGIAHCLLTNPGGSDIAYWNFDGTNFGEIYQMYQVDPGSDVPGKNPNDFYDGYMNTATQGGDLAVSPDGDKVAIAGLHPRRQVDITIGSFGGEIWPDDWEAGVSEGTIIMLYDTEGQREGTNIPNNDPKPYTDIQISYSNDGNLHVVYDAAYVDVFIDTVSYFPGYSPAADDWWRVHSSACVGDVNASFYDGTEHPKPQLLYWNNVSNTITTLAECEFPKAGEKYVWFSDGIWQHGGAGNWGKNYDDSPLSNFDLVANWDPQEGEPDLVLVWEEMQGNYQVLVDADSAFGPNYYAFNTDLKISVYDGTGWSQPVNISNTPDLGEQSVSVYRDVIDNKIHMMYYRDSYIGRDRNLCYADDYEDKYTFYTSGGVHNSIPIRVNQNELVDIVYQEVDLTPYMTGVKDHNPLPQEFALAQNYPNPFNPTTSINYTVPSGQVTLEVYNVMGQKVKTLVDKAMAAGSYDAEWDATDFTGNLVSGGVYLYKLQSDAGVQVKKMVLQK